MSVVHECFVFVGVPGNIRVLSTDDCFVFVGVPGNIRVLSTDDCFVFVWVPGCYLTVHTCVSNVLLSIILGTGRL